MSHGKVFAYRSYRCLCCSCLSRGIVYDSADSFGKEVGWFETSLFGNAKGIMVDYKDEDFGDDGPGGGLSVPIVLPPPPKLVML